MALKGENSLPQADRTYCLLYLPILSTTTVDDPIQMTGDASDLQLAHQPTPTIVEFPSPG
jgi:hypothetical protein